MMTTKCDVLLMGTFLLCLGLTVSIESRSENTVTDICLGCLCESINGCQRDIKCKFGMCGAYHMTFPFWVEGLNEPLKNESAPSEEDMKAFEDCAGDFQCATETVQRYMKKFARDCNGDNEINCVDYVAIHKLGPHGCTSERNYAFEKPLMDCLRKNQSKRIV